MKYVVVRYRDQQTPYEEHERPILFQEEVIHKDVKVRGCREIVSAGFWYMKDGVVHVRGNSESLMVSSRPEDAKLIAEMLGVKH